MGRIITSPNIVTSSNKETENSSGEPPPSRSPPLFHTLGDRAETRVAGVQLRPGNGRQGVHADFAFLRASAIFAASRIAFIVAPAWAIPL